jgi:hypothetical protein
VLGLTGLSIRRIGKNYGPKLGAKEDTMKRIIFRCLIPVAALLAGCVVTSVYPFYTQKDLVFEPALVGD